MGKNNQRMDHFKAINKKLYDDHDPLEALKLMDKISPAETKINWEYWTIRASILEKLYFGFLDWHNDLTMENAQDCLSRALKVVEVAHGGEKLLIAKVEFRFFIHFFNLKNYSRANEYLSSAKRNGFDDKNLLSLWESRLEKELKKELKRKAEKDVKVEDAVTEISKEANTKTEETKTPIKAETPKPKTSQPIVPPKPKLRTDWYQTQQNVVISIFTTNLPENTESIEHELINDDRLNLSWRIPKLSSEFQYSIKLFNKVVSDSLKFQLSAKKVEITLTKATKSQWKSLEQQDEKANNNNNNKFDFISKFIDSDDDADKDENDGSADAFFQKIYANADDDTRRAMMKSFVESNGTTLNTNWEDVKAKHVDPHPPSDAELKPW